MSTFASNRQRRALERLQRFYRRLPVAPGECFYCGLPAATEDHCPPLYWVDALGLRYFDERQMPLVTVPACQQCNHWLGKERLLTLPARAGYVMRFIEKRYRGVLKHQPWTPEEIIELVGSLKLRVQRIEEARKVVEGRIKSANRHG